MRPEVSISSPSAAIPGGSLRADRVRAFAAIHLIGVFAFAIIAIGVGVRAVIGRHLLIGRAAIDRTTIIIIGVAARGDRKTGADGSRRKGRAGRSAAVPAPIPSIGTGRRQGADRECGQ